MEDILANNIQFIAKANQYLLIEFDCEIPAFTTLLFLNYKQRVELHVFSRAKSTVEPDAILN